MQITEFLGYLQEYGVSVTLIAMVLFFAFAFGQIGLKYWQERLKPTIATNPRNHAFFSTSQRLIDYNIPRMRISGDEARNALFRNMLTLKLTVWRQTMLNLVARDFSTLKTFEIKELFSKTIRDIIFSYEEDWKQDGVPEIVTKKFGKWHAPRLEAVSVSANSVFDGRSFVTPNGMLNAILCLQNALLVETIIDAERTLGDLNGELSGLLYKGLTLQ